MVTQKKRQMSKKKQSKGLGDTVSKAIKKMTGGKIEECDSCKKRKEMA